jgi:N-acyl-D-aspartate/D-glutamate deacylase
VISGEGLVLTPGLIDVNSCGWLSAQAAILKAQDGITTYLNAHGDGFRANASKFKYPQRLNFATSVGLIPVFESHLGKEEMMAALEDSLRFGAYTISLSPEYTAATTPEIVRSLSRHFAHKNVLFTFHLRYSSEQKELDGLQEAIHCAAAGNPVHILHITSTGATFHPEQARQMIDAAIQSGMDVSYDFYPYTAWASSIHRARFEGDWQQRYQVNFSKIRILEETNLNPKRFAELKRDPQEHMVVVESIPQATVDYFATNTTCPIGTDSEVGPDTNHPRGAGSFAKFVNDYVDTGKVDFGQAMYRFSTLAARQFARYIPALAKRGVIAEGWAADLVLWDRDKIRSRANFANPNEPSSGVVAAFVNGKPIILDEKPVELLESSGRHLKGAWAD